MSRVRMSLSSSLTLMPSPAISSADLAYPGKWKHAACSTPLREANDVSFTAPGSRQVTPTPNLSMWADKDHIDEVARIRKFRLLMIYVPLHLSP